MISLYVLLGVMLLSALCLLALPFIRCQQIVTPNFGGLMLLTALLATCLYLHSSDIAALQEWETRGKDHYALMIKLNELGGIPGMLARIKQKLAANPDDAYGWFILGKLYITSQDYPNAKAALMKAHALNSTDPQINAFYDYLNKN